jgi:Insertion element 4 transposase N-terminal
MDRMPQGGDNVAQDSLPFVRGFYQLIPEHRLAAIRTRTARSSERRRRLPADSVIWLMVAMALFVALTNPDDMPAHEPPLVDHERWEEELAVDEIKTHLSVPAVTIRSKTPAGVGWCRRSTAWCWLTT